MVYYTALILLLLVSAAGAATGWLVPLTGGGSAGKSATVALTPCGALQLDFTVVTGCNAVAIPFIVR